MAKKTKNVHIILRITPEEKGRLQKQADKEGRTLSNLVRYILQNELKKKR